MDRFESMIKFTLEAKSEPSEKINEAIIETARRTKNMSKFRVKKLPAVAMLTFVLLTATGGTAFAAWQYLHPKEVAVEAGDKKLADAFSGKDARKMNISKTQKGIRVTILGVTSGKNLSDFVTKTDEGILRDRSYLVTAFSREDGSNLTKKDIAQCADYYVSPYIKGQDPTRVNIATLDGGYSAFEKDGIYYRLVECNNLEIFAKQGVYLGICDEPFNEANAYVFDKNTGVIKENKAYKGINMLFEIPFDKSKADADAVEKKIKEWKAVQSDKEADDKDEEPALDTKWSAKDIKEKAELQQNTVKTLTPDKDGNVEYSWKVKGISGDGTMMLPLEDYKVGELNCYGYTSLDDGRNVIETCTKNADGTVTLAIYVEK